MAMSTLVDTGTCGVPVSTSATGARKAAPRAVRVGNTGTRVGRPSASRIRALGAAPLCVYCGGFAPEGWTCRGHMDLPLLDYGGVA